MNEKGHCKHGEFDLMVGCPQCMAERAGAKAEDVAIAFGIDGTTEPVKALALRPGEDVEVRSYHTEAVKFLESAEARVIKDENGLKSAVDDLNAIGRLEKAMEAKKREGLDPLKEQAEAIRETYSTLMDPVFAAKKITKDKMLAYDQEQKRIRAKQEEINRLREEAAEVQSELDGEPTEAVDLVEVQPKEQKSTYTSQGGAGTTDHWKYEVFDFALLDDAYKVEDKVMLGDTARKYHDTKQVPGVRFYNEPIISRRG